MSRVLQAAGLFLVLLLVLTAGCRRQVLNFAETLQVTPAHPEAKIIDGPIREQKVQVTVDASGGPVNVYVLLEKNRQALEDSLERGQKPANVLASSTRVGQGTVDATIPAREDFAVVLVNPGTKTAEVKLKITGK